MKTLAKLLCTLLVLMVVASMMPCAAVYAEGDPESCGTNAVYVIENGVLTISAPDSSQPGIINDRAFVNRTDFSSIVVESGITSIGEYAFSTCRATSASIPSSVTSVGECVFWGSDYLQSVNFQASVSTLPSLAFDGCYRMTSVQLSDSITTIGNYAFYYCNALTSFNWPDSLTSIGNNAFEICTSLTAINIPDGVTSIGESAFQSCSKVTSLHIPEGLTSLSDSCFYSCQSLTSVEIPASVTQIGTEAFRYCSNLQRITIKSPFLSSANMNYLTNDTTVYVPLGFICINTTITASSSNRQYFIGDAAASHDRRGKPGTDRSFRRSRFNVPPFFDV